MANISKKLNKWAILCVQDTVFLESVKIAYVYDDGNQAILVTRDDDVYTIGTCDAYQGVLINCSIFENHCVKFLPLAYHHCHFLATTLDFTSFFTMAFLWLHTFSQLDCFGLDFTFCKCIL